MFKYILKRILLLIPVLLGISLLIFTIMQLAPGNPAREILGENATQEAVDKLADEMGLNDPFLVQYGRYLWNVLHGDFGTSYRTRQAVTELIQQRYPTTLRLAFGSITIAVLIGVPLGILSAVRQYSVLDNVSTFLAMILTSMPAFWYGLMLMIIFSLKLRMLPAAAAGNITLKHFILPWITLCGHTLALLLRMTRSTMLEVIRQDYIRTAKAKGAKNKRVIFRHAMRNTLLPIITVIGTQLSVQLGGSIVVENVFSLNGIGTMLIDGIKNGDAPVVMGGVMFIAVVGGIVNLLVDILYTYIDPRLKAQLVAAGVKRRKAA